MKAKSSFCAVVWSHLRGKSCCYRQSFRSPAQWACIQESALILPVQKQVKFWSEMEFARNCSCSMFWTFTRPVFFTKTIEALYARSVIKRRNNSQNLPEFCAATGNISSERKLILKIAWRKDSTGQEARGNFIWKKRWRRLFFQTLVAFFSFSYL